jgi:hypothetical protein
MFGHGKLIDPFVTYKLLKMLRSNDMTYPKQYRLRLFMREQAYIISAHLTDAECIGILYWLSNMNFIQLIYNFEEGDYVGAMWETQ